VAGPILGPASYNEPQCGWSFQLQEIRRWLLPLSPDRRRAWNILDRRKYDRLPACSLINLTEEAKLIEKNDVSVRPNFVYKYKQYSLAGRRIAVEPASYSDRRFATCMVSIAEFWSPFPQWL